MPTAQATKATAKTKARKPSAARSSRARGNATARSLHIGLNSVSPAHYAGWSGALTACEFDARDMEALATSRGMTASLLLTADATRDRVTGALRAAAKQLEAGDLFFLTYSGHGGQVEDVTGEEDDKQDETWCLYDGQLIDDELYLELGRFKADVRILVLSDSCHSGTVTRASVPIATAGTGAPKLMPPAVAKRTYDAHKEFYDGLQRRVLKAAGGKHLIDPDVALAQVAVSPRLGSISATFNPALILISGCQDNQTSLDGPRNGAFTHRLLQVWAEGAYSGTYARFHATIKSQMPATQTPNLFTLGDAVTFLTQSPFQV